MAVFSEMSQSEVVALLETGTPSDGETDVKMIVNKKWEELSLPSGFPKLYDGVTDYTEISAKSFTVEWNILPRADADEMIKKLEIWRCV